MGSRSREWPSRVHRRAPVFAQAASPLGVPSGLHRLKLVGGVLTQLVVAGGQRPGDGDCGDRVRLGVVGVAERMAVVLRDIFQPATPATVAVKGTVADERVDDSYLPQRDIVTARLREEQGPVVRGVVDHERDVALGDSVEDGCELPDRVCGLHTAEARHLGGDAVDGGGPVRDRDARIDDAGPAAGVDRAVWLDEDERGLHDPGAQRVDARGLEVEAGDDFFVPGGHVARPFVCHGAMIRDCGGLRLSSGQPGSRSASRWWTRFLAPPLRGMSRTGDRSVREDDTESMFRFVHAADLHLDSPFSGLADLAPHVASVLQQATFDAYNAIIDVCVERDAQALLVAGDVFDGADRSLKAQLRFVDGLRRLDDAGIRAFICHGNHDPLDGWEATIPFPANVHRFGATAEGVPLDPADATSPMVCGVSYPTREVRQSLLPLFPPPEPGRIMVGLMHANVGGDTGHESYAPCSVTDLEATGYDYWALGHVHTGAVLRPDSPAIVYPGNPQGRHANERGARGVYLAEVRDDGPASLEFIPVDVVRWERVVVSIEDIEDDGALVSAFEKAVLGALESAGGRDLVYRLQLAGRGPLHDSLARPRYIADLREQLNELWAGQRPFAFCGRVDDGTTSPIDRAKLSQGQDFIGDFVRLVDEARSDEAMLADLRRELEPLYEHARAGRYLRDELPSLDALRSLLADAEDLALSGLLADIRR